MTTKTPRTDQLLELINAEMFSNKTAFEEAISLCESLETELSNRSSDIVKPVTKSIEQLTDEELRQLIKDKATFTKFNLPGFDYDDAVGFSMQFVTSEDKWRTATNRMSGKRIKQLGEQNIREQLERRMFHMIRARRPADNQNADIVKPITISHVTAEQSGAFEIHQIKIQGVIHTIHLMKPDAPDPLRSIQSRIETLEKQNKQLLEALTNILDMGNTGEDARAMKELAREAIQYAKGETK